MMKRQTVVLIDGLQTASLWVLEICEKFDIIISMEIGIYIHIKRMVLFLDKVKSKNKFFLLVSVSNVSLMNIVNAI